MLAAFLNSLLIGSAYQPAGVETIHAAGILHVARQAAQVTGGIDDLGQAADLGWFKGLPGEGRSTVEKGSDAMRSLGGFKRTDAIDQRTARRDHIGGGGEHGMLYGGEFGDVARASGPADVGMAANGAGGGAGCIEQHSGGARRRLPAGYIGLDGLGGEAETGEIGFEAGNTRAVAVDGDDPGPGSDSGDIAAPADTDPAELPSLDGFTSFSAS